jgi:hypothetical protein
VLHQIAFLKHGGLLQSRQTFLLPGNCTLVEGMERVWNDWLAV